MRTAGRATVARSNEKAGDTDGLKAFDLPTHSEDMFTTVERNEFAVPTPPTPPSTPKRTKKRRD